MAIPSQPFYFETLRKTTIAFGSLFNNVYIRRFDSNKNVVNTVKVPLSYSSGQKWFVFEKENIPAQTAVKTRMSFPRLAFKLEGISYDPSRKLPTTSGFLSTHDTTDPGKFLQTLSPVPYNLSFSLFVGAKNIDDALQIVEQIIPLFQPSFNLPIKDIPELNLIRDVPVILENVDFTDDYLGSFEEEKITEFTLRFSVKGYLYPPIYDQAIIKKIFLNFYKDAEMAEKQSKMLIKVEPILAAFDSNWDTITEHVELDSNGE